MAFVNNSLGYRYISVKENDTIEFLNVFRGQYQFVESAENPVYRESDYFYGRIRSTDTINRMIEASLDVMRPVGINPRVGDAVVCQYIHGEKANQKWYRAQIVSKWVDMYRVVFVDYGNAAEYHKDVFHDHARIPTKELMKESITCIPFKDKNDYSGIGMKAILCDLMQRYKKQWRFKFRNGSNKEVFNHDTVFEGIIRISIDGNHIP